MAGQLLSRNQTVKRKIPTTPSTPTKNNHSEVSQFLSSLSIFSSLPASELEALSRGCYFASVDPGEYITIEGDADPLGFIVASGRLAMMKTSLNGRELIVELLVPGDIFGLLMTLQKSPAQLSARAQPKSKVLRIPLKSFMNVLDGHPECYRDVIAQLLESLQSSYRIARGLAHDRVETRIATILVSITFKSANNLIEPQDPVIKITRQQLADLTGTSTETAIRITREMQRNGIIEMKSPGRLEILDLKALHELSEK